MSTPIPIKEAQDCKVDRTCIDMSPDALQGLFLLEGHWDRFFPATQAVRAAIKRGLIGKCVAVCCAGASAS